VNANLEEKGAVVMKTEKRVKIVAMVLVFLAGVCGARTITVDDDSPADFNNIQAAIEDANDGDEVVVEDGNYTGDGNRDVDFLGKAITVRSKNGPTNCIIDCNGSAIEPHRAFVFQSSEGTDSIVQGFTIRRGYASEGGGIYCANTGPKIIDCIFSDNSADWGGGVYCNRGSNPKVINCIFEDNSAADFGGAFLCFADATYPFPELVNCTLTNNDADHGGGIALWGTVHDDGSVRVGNSIIWNNTPTDEPGIVTPGCCKCGCVQLYVDHTILQIDWQGVAGSRIVGTGNVIGDPCFADPCRGDYHVKSQAGRWDPNSQTWVTDSVSSPAIDAGNPGCPLGDEPNDANNVRINMGAYGGTAEASKTPANWRSIADFTNDWLVDYNDLSIFVDYWLEAGQCIPSDLDRSQSVNLEDFSIFALQWAEAYLGEPGMTYQIGSCSSQVLGLSATELSEQTRFTVTVDGQYIHFEDTMVANCCSDELGLEMTVEGELITIYETELTTTPCRCICDYAVSATLGPFQPGTYTLDVYEDWGGFIGSTTVTIGSD
jgi:hypothetical protein